MRPDFDFVNKSNKFFEDTDSPNEGLCNFALNALLKLGNILTLFQSKKSGDDASLEKVQKIVVKYGKKADGKNLEELVDLLLEIREEARSNKDWNAADGIRKDLLSNFDIDGIIARSLWINMGQYQFSSIGIACEFCNWCRMAMAGFFSPFSHLIWKVTFVN